MQNQIFITMDGGLIQDISVSKDLEDVEVTVVDFDTEGVEINELSPTPRGEDAVISSVSVDVVGDGDLELWKEILAERK